MLAGLHYVYLNTKRIQLSPQRPLLSFSCASTGLCAGTYSLHRREISQGAFITRLPTAQSLSLLYYKSNHTPAMHDLRHLSRFHLETSAAAPCQYVFYFGFWLHLLGLLAQPQELELSFSPLVLGNHWIYVLTDLNGQSLVSPLCFSFQLVTSFLISLVAAHAFTITFKLHAKQGPPSLLLPWLECSSLRSPSSLSE